jgi:hypothetical protein
MPAGAQVVSEPIALKMDAMELSVDQDDGGRRYLLVDRRTADGWVMEVIPIT